MKYFRMTICDIDFVVKEEEDLSYFLCEGDWVPMTEDPIGRFLSTREGTCSYREMGKKEVEEILMLQELEK